MKKIKVINPICTDIWNEATEKELNKYKDEDTRIEVTNIKKGPESIQCFYDIIWSELFTVQEAEKAEREGYDGVIIYCFCDPGLRAAKEKLDIPVVGSCEPAIHIASLLGNNFSIISPGGTVQGKSINAAINDLIKLYGFEHKCVSIRNIGIDVLGLEKSKSRVAEKVFEEAKKAVKEDGADTIIIGCGVILAVDEAANERVDERILKELKVPVVLPGVPALKICEDLISMKITQSKLYFEAPPELKKRIL